MISITISPNKTILQFGNRISLLGQLITRLNSGVNNEVDLKEDMIDPKESTEAINTGELDEVIAQVYQACIDYPDYKISKKTLS